MLLIWPSLRMVRFRATHKGKHVLLTFRWVIAQKWELDRPRYPPPPPCISYALVQATVGVGTVLIWDLILIRYQT